MNVPPELLEEDPEEPPEEPPEELGKREPDDELERRPLEPLLLSSSSPSIVVSAGSFEHATNKGKLMAKKSSNERITLL